MDHNGTEALTSATIERTLWCVSPFVRSPHFLAFYEQTGVKFILSPIVFQCLLFRAERGLQLSILFPCFISLGKDTLTKMFLHVFFFFPPQTSKDISQRIKTWKKGLGIGCKWVLSGGCNGMALHSLAHVVHELIAKMNHYSVKYSFKADVKCIKKIYIWCQ